MQECGSLEESALSQNVKLQFSGFLCIQEFKIYFSFPLLSF